MDIAGPKILFYIGNVAVTETIAVLYGVSVVLAVFLFFMGRNIEKSPTGKKQIIAEYYYEFINKMGLENLGEENMIFAPFLGTMFLISIGSTVAGFLGFKGPATDINIPAGWALLTFILTIVSAVRKRGVLGWLKSFLEPVKLLLPINIISKIIEPVGMAVRMFGNQLAGMVIMQLINYALFSLSNIIFSFLPFTIPILQIGIPAVASAYFDLFSGFLQAYIFVLLSMTYVGSASIVPKLSQKEKKKKLEKEQKKMEKLQRKTTKL